MKKPRCFPRVIGQQIVWLDNIKTKFVSYARAEGAFQDARAAKPALTTAQTASVAVP